MGAGAVGRARTGYLSSHKAVLFALRLVLLALIASMAVPAWIGGRISPVLPVALAAYLATNAAFAFERGSSFSSQRVQAVLLLFDISVLVVSLASLEEYRQDLFVALFLVVLLASAGQRLAVAVGGFVAVALVYGWFATGRDGIGSLLNAGIGARFTVLLVVALYVGYVSETVARERAKRLEAEERLRREISGMDRSTLVGAGVLTELRAETLLPTIGAAARSLLPEAKAAVVWWERGTGDVRWDDGADIPPSLLWKWSRMKPEESLLHQAHQKDRVLRIAHDPTDPAAAEHGFSETLVAPFSVPISRLDGCILASWPAGHEHLLLEEEAVRLLARQAGIALENAALYDFLCRARDAWQGVVLSIPNPVVVVDRDGKVSHANSAFVTLCGRALPDLVGSPFLSFVQTATREDGKRPAPEDLLEAREESFFLAIRGADGTYEAVKAPYVNPAAGDGSSVWILRRVSEAIPS